MSNLHIPFLFSILLSLKCTCVIVMFCNMEQQGKSIEVFFPFIFVEILCLINDFFYLILREVKWICFCCMYELAGVWT